MTRRIDSPNTKTDDELRAYLEAKTLGCFVMVAGAGSGKTTSLVKALDHIGKHYGTRLRQHGQQVACITYTEVAVGEIWGDVGNNPLFHVSTIHSFLWSLVRPFQIDIAVWVKNRIQEKLTELRAESAGFGKRVQQKTRDRNERAIVRLERDILKIDGVRHFTYGTGSHYAKGILGHDDITRIGPQLILSRPLMVTLIAQKYPFIFVDESQDTLPEVVDALRFVAKAKAGNFCLGFFGDPMQKVYMSGIGAIECELDAGWKRIAKPENFRCPTNILSVINNIRSKGDGLMQTRGRYENEQPVPGTARLFVVPPDDKPPAILDKIRAWLDKTDGDHSWTSDEEEADVRILVIEHRMAARRLGFSELHSAFTDGAPDSLSQAFNEGSAWPLKPFQDVLLPLVEAFNEGQQFLMMELLRKHSLRLDPEAMMATKHAGTLLLELKNDVKRLADMLSKKSDTTTYDVLRFALDVKLLELDERLLDYIAPETEEISLTLNIAEQDVDDGDDEGNESQQETEAIGHYLKCPAAQLWGYNTYQSRLSRYATHQGVKGAEFKRVIVVLGDGESRYRLFSYDKLLGLKPPSDTDLENQQQGKDSVYERTRRLLYVCCSRATKDLAVVLHTDDVKSAAQLVMNSGLFEPKDVYTLDML